jgi:hypothetical protein
MPLLTARVASQQFALNVASDYASPAYLAIDPLRHRHLTLFPLTQQRLPLLVERRVLDIVFVHEDSKAYAVSPEIDPALLCLVIMHAVSHNMRNIVKIADCRHVPELEL